MTNEKILNTLYAAGKKMKDFDVCMSIVNRENGMPKLPGGPEYDLIIAGLIYELEKEMCEKGIKSAGKANLLATAKNILKTAKRDLPHKPDLQKPYTSGKYQCFCDGFRLLALSGNKKLEIDTTDRELINAENIIPKDYNNFVVLPELVNLKLEIARFKSEYTTKHNKNRIMARFKDDKNNIIFCVNAEYLFDAIKATGAKNIYYKSAKSTLLVESENVKCAIMPIGYKKQHETIGTFHYIDVSPSGEICIVTEIVTTEDTNKEIA